MLLEAKFIPPTTNCVAKTMINIGIPTNSMIFSMKNNASKDFVEGKSSSLSFPENTKRSPHSNKSALKLNSIHKQ